METIGQRIARLRKERRWSLRALGERAGIAHQSVANIEKDDVVSIGSDTLVRLAHAFKVPVSYLVGEAPGDGLAFGLDVERAQHVIGLLEGFKMSDPEHFLLQMSQLSVEEQELMEDIVDMMVIRRRHPRKRLPRVIGGPAKNDNRLLEKPEREGEEAAG